MNIPLSPARPLVRDLALVVLALALAFSSQRGAIQAANTLRGHDILVGIEGLRNVNSVDEDMVGIVRGVRATPTLAGTLKWWTGPWVNAHNGSLRFYRPLTSLLFWGEYQLFGERGLREFMLVLIAAHILFVGCFALLARAVGGFGRSLLCVVFFIYNVPALYGLPDSSWALARWKDTPEPVLGLACVASLCLFLAYCKSGRKWYLALSLAAYACAVLVKETGYMLPPIVLALLWSRRQLRTRWRLSLPFFVATALLVLLRLWALRVVVGGYSGASWHNNAWAIHWLDDVVGGLPLIELMRGDGLPMAVTCLLIAIWAGVRYRANHSRGALWCAVAAGAAALGLYLWTELCYSVNFGDALLRLTEFEPSNCYEPWRDIALTASLVYFWVASLSNLRRGGARGQAFAWVMGFLMYLPVLKSGYMVEHALYVVSATWALWLSCAFWEAGQRLWRSATRHRAEVHP